MTQSSLDRAGWQQDLHWVSVFLRASLGSLFLAAAISKVPHGIAGTVGYYSTLFEHSLLPAFLVQAHASVIMLVEFALAFWLLSGYRLALAWKSAALVLVSLAVGMVFAGKTDVASDNYVYVALALGGLVTSRFDRWVPARLAAGAGAQELTSGAEHAPARS
ncbi:MAG: hypothetical protein RL685_7775 [Pseudomonadota bacterium]|jgi:hypothetical protein